jgi:ABC-type amino acid transport system permease subunit
VRRRPDRHPGQQFTAARACALPDEITMGRFVLPATARVATGAITNERYLNDRIQFTRL